MTNSGIFRAEAFCFETGKEKLRRMSKREEPVTITVYARNAELHQSVKWDTCSIGIITKFTQGKVICIFSCRLCLRVNQLSLGKFLMLVGRSRSRLLQNC